MLSLFAILWLRSPFNFTIQNGKKLTFEQKLNHFNSRSTETFHQTYYRWDRNPPNPKSIVLFLGSENLKDQDFSASAVKFAEANNASLFSLEHRFFGSSYPEDIDYLLSKENLQIHLTSDQILNDIGNFLQDLLSHTHCANSDSNSKCDVTIFAGGYLGTIANWFHLKYPHLATNVISSSSPLNIEPTFSFFDTNVFTQLKQFNLKCADGYLSIVQKIYDDENKTKVIEEFGLDPNLFRSNNSFYYAMAEVFSTLFVYRNIYKEFISEKFCDPIVQSTERKIETLAESFKHLVSFFDYTNQSLNIEYPVNDSLSSEYRDYRSLYWLQCNEIGLWHEASKDPSGTFRNPNLNFDYFNTVCQTLFSKNLTVVNANTYGQKELTSISTILINGADDPMFQSFVSTNNSANLQYSLIINGGSHNCDMMEPRPEKAQKALDQAFDFINTWTSDMNNGKQCDKGWRSFGECTCMKGYGGPLCQHRMHQENSFKIITILAVAVPTALLLVIGAGVWFSGRHEDNEIGARPTLYT